MRFSHPGAVAGQRIAIRLRGVLFTLALGLIVAGCGSSDQSKPAADSPAAESPINEAPAAQSSSEAPTRDAPAKAVTVRVAAASDLKFAFEDVITAFAKEHPQITVELTFGSSGNFYSQLTNKAPFDVYLSADIEYPRKLIEAGLADAKSEFLYAIGQIVIWTPKTASFNVEELGIEALQKPSVKKIAIANPAHAPYGRAAEAALKNLGVYDAVKEKLVLGDNIAQTAQFVESGAAEVGIIALSLALAPSMKDKGRYWTVPRDAYPPLEQGGVIMSWATDTAAADALRQFIMGKAGRDILTQYGFELPEG